jgi:hypothetical protein
MMTVRQIERNWTNRQFPKLLEDLLANRSDGFGPGSRRPIPSPALWAAAMALIRLDELSQSDAPITSTLIRTILASQEADGGWGDLMTIALCLRALSAGLGGGPAVVRGLEYLAHLQQPAGIWPSVSVRRMPPDPYVSAFILLHLGDNADFRRSIQFAQARNWFDTHDSTLDKESLAIWDRARLRCRVHAQPARMGYDSFDLNIDRPGFGTKNVEVTTAS